jgi:hypothetical protein
MGCGKTLRKSLTGLNRLHSDEPRTCVLGYFQPELSKLAGWAILWG